MLRIRRAAERGHANHGWLDTRYTFSFANYHDPAHMGFRSLRVMNDDRVQAGTGFGMHPHRDMEIVTCVLEGALEHRDSMGHGSVLRAGELQRITAGTGMFHSEFNPSDREPVHLYQIWILPDRKGLTPSYEQRSFDPLEKCGRLRLTASPDGSDGSLRIHQDARIYLADLEKGEQVRHAIAPGRHAWLQVLRGGVEVGEQRLFAGDGLAVSEEDSLLVSGLEKAEVMVIDLA
jgi:redox-sensitive bicupin YhaK (pirin superfamily)